MTPRRLLRTFPAATLTAALAITSSPSAQPAPLAMDTARVTIAGTSNVHPYSVWTDTVRVTRVVLAPSAPADPSWAQILEPGVVKAFEIAIPVATLTSRDNGLDENLYKALKLETNRDILFRLAALERVPGGPLMAVGKLRIAGVEREVVLPLDTEARDGALVVRGKLPLLMTDYGIAPPTAMLGMLKTDPKVIVTFEVVLSMRTT